MAFVSQRMANSGRYTSDVMTYAEHCQRQRDYERKKFAQLSKTEQDRIWLRRQMWLWTWFLQMDNKYVIPTASCPACAPIQLKAHHWPIYFECLCGTFVILDKWIPDGVERVTMMTHEGLEKFKKMHAEAYDLYDYPLEQRLKDLSGWKAKTASADSDAAI
jgi:hypothetical protein